MHFTRRLRRYPVAWWALVIFMAATVGYAVTSSLERASAAAAQFEGMTSVAVFERPLSPGSVIKSDDVRTESRPQAFLPKEAIVLDPVGRVVAFPVSAGEVVHERNAGAAGLSPTAALLQPNERAIAIDIQRSQPSLRIGDLVDVIATFDEVERGSTATIAEGSRVVHLEKHTAMVAVPADRAAKVAFAVTQGKVMLAVTPAKPISGGNSVDVSSSE